MKGTSKWDIIFGKMKKFIAIEMYYGGDMDIDNVEYSGLMIELGIMKMITDY